MHDDPKLDLFVQKLQTEIFDTKKNPTGKLVIFSESVDTLNYLEKKLKERLNRIDILKVSSDNRDKDKKIIRECFDANYKDTPNKNKYNIIIASDVLAEGVNLHRANVIVNYDTPWNATRLMQRIGRVNRIGSVAGAIYNYMFYPSDEGNRLIKLYENALVKLQGFHSALGEDAKIYSKEEILKEFQLYNPNVKDDTDKELQLLREVRELYNTDRKLYKKIKALPMKTRTARAANKLGKSGNTLAFIQSNRKTKYYLVGDKVEVINFLTAADIMRASRDEKAIDFASVSATHYVQVNMALEQFKKEIIVQKDNTSIKVVNTDKKASEALRFLRHYCSIIDDDDIEQKINTLMTHIKNGTFAPLVKKVCAMAKEYKNTSAENQYEIDIKINEYYSDYGPVIEMDKSTLVNDESEPNIVISESFK